METIVKCTSRKFGDIGEALVAFPAEGWSLGGKPLQQTVVEYLVNYGVRQCLGDAYASAGNVDEAKGLFGKRYDRLLDGTIGVRESGGAKLADDPVTVLATKNAKAALLSRFDKVVPGAKRMSDYVAHASIAPYFKLDKEDAKKAVWVEAKVAAWMTEQAVKAAAGDAKAVDFMADAERTLSVEVTVDLDF